MIKGLTPLQYSRKNTPHIFHLSFLIFLYDVFIPIQDSPTKAWPSQRITSSWIPMIFTHCLFLPCNLSHPPHYLLPNLIFLLLLQLLPFPCYPSLPLSSLLLLPFIFLLHLLCLSKRQRARKEVWQSGAAVARTSLLEPTTILHFHSSKGAA